jgi:hypothetical protein
MVGAAAPDHDPAGVDQRVDAFGGDLVGVLAGGRRAGDCVERVQMPI